MSQFTDFVCFLHSRFERAIELQMDILNYIKPFIKGNCWDLDYHIELAKLSIYTGTNYASFTVCRIFIWVSILLVDQSTVSVLNALVMLDLIIVVYISTTLTCVLFKM